MSDPVTTMQQVMAEADCLYTKPQVEQAIERMADAISEQLQHTNPLIVCVMNGGLIVTGQLLPLLNFPLQADYAHVSRYREQTTGGALEWKVHPQSSLVGRTVLIVDDILDEGTTLEAIAEACRAEGAERVFTAVLIEKHHDRKAAPAFQADFVGLDATDRYLFGYGMDYKGYWRNAPGIFAVKGL